MQKDDLKGSASVIFIGQQPAPNKHYESSPLSSSLIRPRPKLLYVAVILLLISNTLVITRGVIRRTAYANWLLHTRQVQTQISATRGLLIDSETGQRGFLLTGKTAYLEPYNRGISTIDRRLGELEQLTHDNPNQQRILGEVRGLANQKLAELGTTVTLANQGNISAARKIVMSDQGKILMDRLRQMFDGMEKEEERLLENRQRDWERSTREIYLSLVVGTLVSATLLVLLARAGLRLLATQQRAALAVADRENWLATTIRSIGDAVIATDEHGVITLTNATAEAICMQTAENMMGKLLTEALIIVSEESGQRIENPVSAVLQTRTAAGLANHAAIQRPDGSLCPIEDSAAPILDEKNNLLGMVMVFRDVSQDRKIRETLRRSERLAAVGRLSATIAHEINNPLASVTNLLHLIKTHPKLAGDIREWVLLAEEELARVSHIAKQTLSFFRANTQPEVIALTPVIEQTVFLYRRRLEGRGVTVHCDLDSEARVVGIKSEFTHLISNLLSNSLDVLGSGGIVTIVTKSGVNRIFMSIEDNGPGIPMHVRSRVFEPFFTTKKDVGTGLGLWIVEEITRKFDGSLHLETETEPKQSFTRFEFVFPPAEKVDNSAAS